MGENEKNLFNFQGGNFIFCQKNVQFFFKNDLFFFKEKFVRRGGGTYPPLPPEYALV